MKRWSIAPVLLLIGMIGVGILCWPIAASEAASAPNPTVKAPAKQTPGSSKAEWDKTLEDAKKEGTVLVYSTPGVHVIRALADAFGKRYSIKVDWILGRGEELAQRIQTEKNAGIRAVDVIISGAPTALTVMKPRGLLGKLDPVLILPEVTDPKAWTTKGLPFIDKDHTTMSLASTFMRFVMRNTNMVQENEITSYKDLLKPKWKGKMVINDPTVTGTGSNLFTMLALQVWNPEETKEFMQGLVKQDLVITRERRLQAEWVARGKYALSLATNMENVIEFIKLNAPVSLCKVKEGGASGAGAGGLSVPETVAHPNASKVFVNWLLSKEGQDVFVKAYGSPSLRKDATREGAPPQMFPEPDEKVHFDTEETVLYRAEMMKTAKEIFAPLL